MRDTAVGGLVSLLARRDWRSSGDAGAIVASVTAGLHDDSPVVRMRAAEGVLAIHADDDAERQASAVGDLVLARLHEGGEPGVGGDDVRRDVTVDLMTYLAVVAESPFASTTVERWCEHAPTRPSAARRVAQSARQYLASAESEIQARAFALIRVAADASAARLARDPGEPAPDLSEAQLAEIQGAVLVCHDIAQQVYFASGAFDGKRGSTAEPAKPDAGFAELAMPVLRRCASTRVPQCVHPAVETMVFLAPLDEASVLQAVADAVPADSSYAGDPLAGDVVVGYLQRLLAEQRPLVLFDAEGADAFRRLLATFAAAGNQEALSLAYTFADVFR